MTPASEALKRLQEGNRRFVAGTQTHGGHRVQARRDELAAGQNPFAIILGCSDSRVPSEMIFDQGLGDLFVIRVAGNIVAPSQVGSVEFAAVQFGVRLVVVLGHSQCGAVLAALESMDNPAEGHSNDLNSIVDRITPCLHKVLEYHRGDDRESLVAKAVHANVRSSVNQLRTGSPTLEQLIRSEGLEVIGAEYSLETGKVEFFNGADE